MNGLLGVVLVSFLFLAFSHGFVSQRSYVASHVVQQQSKTTRLLDSKWDNLIDEEDDDGKVSAL